MNLKSNDEEKTEETNRRVVIIGVGNLLLKDEGIGIHVIKHLQEMELPPGIELIDGGTSPDLIAYTRTGDRVIIVDAAKAGGEPGTIYRFLPDDLADDYSTLASAHELGVTHNLKLMVLSGNEPDEVIIIGIEPKEIDYGIELTPELREKLPEITEIVMREIGIDKTKG